MSSRANHGRRLDRADSMGEDELEHSVSTADGAATFHSLAFTPLSSTTSSNISGSGSGSGGKPKRSSRVPPEAQQLNAEELEAAVHMQTASSNM